MLESSVAMCSWGVLRLMRVIVFRTVVDDAAGCMRVWRKGFAILLTGCGFVIADSLAESACTSSGSLGFRKVSFVSGLRSLCRAVLEATGNASCPLLMLVPILVSLHVRSRRREMEARRLCMSHISSREG